MLTSSDTHGQTRGIRVSNSFRYREVIEIIIYSLLPSTFKINHTQVCEMATIKQEISDEVINSERKEENIKMEITKSVAIADFVVKTEKIEEKKQMDTTDGPNNEKTEADAENGKLTTGTNVNCDLDDKIIRQIEVLKHFTFANDVLINFVYYSLVLFWRL